MRTLCLLLVTAIFYLQGCSQSSPTVTSSAGLGARLNRTSGTGVATLAWEPPAHNDDGSTLDDLAGYYIHYGTDPKTLTGTILLSNPALTTFAVDHLASGTYFFTVTAFNTGGKKSAATPMVSKTIP